MKKHIAYVLVLLMILSLFVGCNGGSAEVDYNQTVMTIGGYNISLKEYDFTYMATVQEFCTSYQTYLQYLELDTSVSLKEQNCKISEKTQTWAEFFMDQTEEMLTQVYVFYNAAVAEGMTLSAAGEEQLDSFMLALKDAAAAAKVTEDEYLSVNYGPGLTAADYREMVSRRLLATQYCDEKIATLTYTDAEYEAYFEKNKDTLEHVDVRVYTVTESYLPADFKADTEDTTDAKVKAYAELFAEGLTSQEEFAKRALSFAPEGEKVYYETANSTLMVNVASDEIGVQDMKTWLFDRTRAEGDISIFQTSTATYTVCYFVSRQRDENPMVAMRHLLLKVDDKTEGKSDAEVAAAIQEIYDGWVADGATEEGFIKLATEKTEDTGSKTNGGYYDFFARGTMVSRIEDWLYEEGRQLNEHTIIKTSYGYHIVLFKGYGEIGWKHESTVPMQDEDYYKMFDRFCKEQAVTYVENHRDLAGNVKMG